MAGARVLSEIVRQGKGKKIIVFKKKRRKKYRRKQGHRQLYTALEIKDHSGVNATEGGKTCPFERHVNGRHNRGTQKSRREFPQRPG